jgi:hypothetical protein
VARVLPYADQPAPPQKEAATEAAPDAVGGRRSDQQQLGDRLHVQRPVGRAALSYIQCIDDFSL